MNNTHLDQAREWARDNIDDFYEGERVYAVCEVVQSLPDEWIDAEELRELVVKYEAFAEDAEPEGEKGRIRAALYRNFAGVLEALLPTPPLLTLADMDEDARHAMVGKDVNVEGWNNPSMLIAVHKDEGAVLGHNWINPWPFVEVRPLSELTPVDTAPDQQVNGSESPKGSLPRPEDVPSGEAWLIAYEGGFHTALKADSRDSEPWVISFVPDGGFLWLSDRDVTLISRLVPEDKP